MAAAGIAAEAGVRAGDVVYQVNGQRVESGEAAEKANTLGRHQFMWLNLWRDERPYLIRIWPAQ